MQNVYITRNGKQIQLTVDEIKAAWAAWDAELREEQLDAYKEEVKQTLLKLSKENDDPKYEMAANNKDIIDEIARDIRRAIKNGCDHDWCFNTSKYGGFMDSYDTAIVVWGKADDIDETDY